MDFKEQLKKAREEYRRAGKMTHTRACVLLNCNYTQQIITEKCDLLFETEEFTEKAINILKGYEKCRGVGRPLAGDAVALACIYVAGYSYELNSRRYTYSKLLEISLVNESAIRKHVRKIFSLIRIRPTVMQRKQKLREKTKYEQLKELIETSVRGQQ